MAVVVLVLTEVDELSRSTVTVVTPDRTVSVVVAGLGWSERVVKGAMLMDWVTVVSGTTTVAVVTVPGQAGRVQVVVTPSETTMVTDWAAAAPARARAARTRMVTEAWWLGV